jgi:glucan phosphorylase
MSKQKATSSKHKAYKDNIRPKTNTVAPTECQCSSTTKAIAALSMSKQQKYPQSHSSNAKKTSTPMLLHHHW